MMTILVEAYITVLVVELAGDKTLYTVGVLATRYRPGPLAFGMLCALMTKVGVAVMLAHFLRQIPGPLLAAITTISFLTMAVVLWYRRPQAEGAAAIQSAPFVQVSLLTFAAVFFTEWADAGQITAGALALRHHAVFYVWIGASLALATKGAIALTLGNRLRGYIRPAALRYSSAALCLVMAVLSATRID